MIGYVTLGSNDIGRAAAFYDELLRLLGAQDEGPPGPRGLAGFYAAYFRDLDGHKLNCFCWKPA